VAAAEAAQSSGVSVSSVSGRSQPLFCELCYVSCSGRDDITEHLKGIGHLKVDMFFVIITLIHEVQHVYITSYKNQPTIQDT